MPSLILTPLTLLTVTLRSSEYDYEDTLLVNADATVASAKEEILRRFRLTHVLNLENVLLVMRSAANPLVTYASSPYPLHGEHCQVVEDERELVSFLDGRAVFHFAFFRYKGMMY